MTQILVRISIYFYDYTHSQPIYTRRCIRITLLLGAHDLLCSSGSFYLPIFPWLSYTCTIIPASNHQHPVSLLPIFPPLNLVSQVSVLALVEDLMYFRSRFIFYIHDDTKITCTGNYCQSWKSSPGHAVWALYPVPCSRLLQ